MDYIDHPWDEALVEAEISVTTVPPPATRPLRESAVEIMLEP